MPALLSTPSRTCSVTTRCGPPSATTGSPPGANAKPKIASGRCSSTPEAISCVQAWPASPTPTCCATRSARWPCRSASARSRPNVAADGHSCPFRHRCSGCEYFRTDPSFQPELSAYLAQLLADRERLAGALPQLAEWARRDAAPSEKEIDAVRRLLRANDEALAALDNDDRAAVEEAISTIRKQRAALGVTFPVELRGIVAQPKPALFPTIEADARPSHARA